ncbi:hypothetical protein JCM8547_002109 [Rhodosporidiobolus lusitaniae]
MGRSQRSDEQNEDLSVMSKGGVEARQLPRSRTTVSSAGRDPSHHHPTSHPSPSPPTQQPASRLFRDPSFIPSSSGSFHPPASSPPPIPHSFLPHKPHKLNIDFKLPSSFTRDGLPLSGKKNQYLPLHLQDLDDDSPPATPHHRHTRHPSRGSEEISYRQRVRRATRRNREEEDGGDGLMFPILLSFLLILLPVLVLTGVLGVVFSTAGINA